jgi:RNA polymerase sigma-70 factor (ECF subfamily)
VATILAAKFALRIIFLETPFFPRKYINFGHRRLRGTAPANGSSMNSMTTVDVNETKECPTPSDWPDLYGDYLFNFAVGQVRDVTVAEDLVQETFLAAIKAHDRFAGNSSERTWLVGILRHKIYDHLRRVCRERPVRLDLLSAQSDKVARDESVLWLHDVSAECVSPSRRMELDEFREVLEMALGQLPPRIAQVFQLYEIEECSNREVCAQMNISENNLWVMLHRARRQLRKELFNWWIGDSRMVKENRAEFQN